MRRWFSPTRACLLPRSDSRAIARFLPIALLFLASQMAGPLPAGAQQQYAAGEILAKYRPGVSENEIAQVNSSHATRVLEVVPELGIYRLAIPNGRTVLEMIEEYTADPRCEHVGANYVGEGGDFIPADTFFGLQWHLNNTGQTGGTADADIDAVEGWQITRGDSSVIVAVLDSGIDSDHPEFQGRMLPGFDFVNSDDDPEDDLFHGTLVSGLLGANADNLFSVAGVDHLAQILPVKVLNQFNTGTVFALIQGLVFSANQGAHVINMSLIDFPVGFFGLEFALQFARDSGAILIACAGNGGIGDADLSGPGASPLTISVGATTDTDERASFSGTGSALDVVAPGLLVPTVRFDSPLDKLSFFSGCSAATPIVSGIASLLLPLGPSLTHDQVREILTETADDLIGPPSEDTLGRDDFFGHGRVNMHTALSIFVNCGDGTLDPGEECDASVDAACPGLCKPDCRCASTTCTLENSAAVITTLGKGQSPANNAKVVHAIAGNLVGGAAAYGPKASRIKVCEGTSVSVVITAPTGTPTITGACTSSFCTIPAVNVVEKYQVLSRDRKDRDRITLIPVP